jgi:O-antigen/teichoic acid export membrane protein
VPQYAVPFRLFSIVTVVTSFLITPLWPAYGEALERGDHLWIRRTLYRSLILTTGAAVVMSGALVLLGPRIINVWVGSSIQPSLMLLVGLGIWGVVSAVSSTVSVFLNGLSVVRFQIYLVLAGAVTNILASVYLTRRIGIPGVVYGSILSQLFIGFIPYYLYVRQYLKRDLREVSSGTIS